MRIIRSLESMAGDYPYPVLTIGAFDGIHLGHQEIIGRVRERAREQKGTSMLFTFGDHPLKVMDPGSAPPLITPPEIKRAILRKMGLDLLIQVPFSREFSRKEPRAFIEEILLGRLGMREIWVGFDFVFGKDRRGDISLLQERGQQLGFSVKVVPSVRFQGKIVSSTLIRELLKEGRVAEACRLLGRPYLVAGEVVKGSGRGRHLGFPTANIGVPKDFLLPNGVYAGWAKVRGKTYRAAINVGTSPTFAHLDRRIEAHLLTFQGNLYGMIIQIHFREKVREESRFMDEEELARRIREDTDLIAQLLSQGEGVGATGMANEGCPPPFHPN
jgi:riboflavin kinase/FMN adenylyltransferase